MPVDIPATIVFPIGPLPEYQERGIRGAYAFTYIELLAILAILGILLAIFVPYLMSAREKDRQMRCSQNLLRIRDALQQYSKANHSDYPRVEFDPTHIGYTAFTGPNAPTPFVIHPTTRTTTAPLSTANGVQPNDVTASLWLLVRDDYITDLSVFICPSTQDQPDSAAGQRSNFRRLSNLSYSYACPFSGYADYRLNSDAMPGGFALMADRNPGNATPAHDAPPFELAKANSRNHLGVGQNVLFADGSVSFETTPYCGVGRDASAHSDGDNIYTALSPHALLPGVSPFHAGNGVVGRQYGPAYQYDSYLVPTEMDGP